MANSLPRQRGCQIVDLRSTSRRPNLVGYFLINQQGFDVDFGEHEASMNGLKIDRSIRNWPVLAEMGPHPEGVRGRKNRSGE